MVKKCAHPQCTQIISNNKFACLRHMQELRPNTAKAVEAACGAWLPFEMSAALARQVSKEWDVKA